MEIVSDDEPDDEQYDLINNLSKLSVSEHIAENDESTADEQYSKTVGDTTFLKFVKRLERAPEQILR